ncbi:unnamed protein product [Tilletia caries]|nr:unnamed protein product [Tilletia caries]
MSRGPNAPGLSNLRLRAPVTLPSFSGSDSLSSSSHFVGSSPNTSYSRSSTSGSSSLPCRTASPAYSSSSGLSSSSGGPSGSSSTSRLHDSSSNSGIAPGRPARRGRSVAGELKQQARRHAHLARKYGMNAAASEAFFPRSTERETARPNPCSRL